VIGRVAGAPLVLQPMWFLVAAVFTAILVPLVERALPGVATGWTVAVAASFVLVLFGSVLLHELAHAWVARALGRTVHEVVLSALGGHTSFHRGSLGPGGSALVAAAGPAVNLVLGGLLLAGAQPFLGAPSLTQRALGVLVASAASANLLVAGFNLVPGLPLDGGQLLASLVWRITGRERTGTVVAAWVGRALAVGIVAWAVLVPLARGLVPDTFSMLWMLAVAFAVWTGATGALRRSRTEERAGRLSVESVGRPARGVSQDATGAELAALARAGERPTELVLLDEAGRAVGYVDRAALDAVPPAVLAETPAWAVGVPLRPGAVVDAGLSGSELLFALVPAFRIQQVVVGVRGGEPVALFVDAEVARALG